MAAKRKRRRSGVRRSILYVPLIFLAVCVVCLFGISVFFRVTEVQVEGAEICDPEEIISNSEIEAGDNLLFINRFTAVGRIKAKQPYVDEVSISRVWPGTVVIRVSESVGVAYVTDSNGFPWIIDQRAKALDRTEWTAVSDLVKIVGLVPEFPEKGETVSEGSGTDLRVTYLTELLPLLQRQGLLAEVSEIDMSNAANPALRYQERFTVKLGSREDMELKFGRMLSAVAQLDASAAGTLDLSLDDDVHYIAD